MHAARRWLAAGCITALVCAMGAAAAVGARTGPEKATERPIAVALVPDLAGSVLVSVDLDSGEVVRRIRLRSLVTDIDADAGRGVIVAAQTGGIGDAADDAVSLTDPRTGSVRYVKLPQIDPSQVECVSGRAMVLHAVVESAGFVISAVGLASGEATAAGHAPDGSGLWAAAGGGLWTAVATQGPVPWAMLRVDPATLATAAGPKLDFVPCNVQDVGGGTLVMGATGADGASRAMIALLDTATASVSATASVDGLPHGAQIAAVVGDRLVVGDWNGETPETASLAVLDRRTLAPLRTIEVGGAPCALASYGDSLLVVDRISGTLLCVDPASGAVRWRAPLGAADLVCSKVVVLPGR